MHNGRRTDSSPSALAGRAGGRPSCSAHATSALRSLVATSSQVQTAAAQPCERSGGPTAEPNAAARPWAAGYCRPIVWQFGEQRTDSHTCLEVPLQARPPSQGSSEASPQPPSHLGAEPAVTHPSAAADRAPVAAGSDGAGGGGSAEGAGSARRAAMQSTTILAAAARLDSLLQAIQPSPASEFRRLTIANYICGVIKRCFQPQHQVRRRPLRCCLLAVACPDCSCALVRASNVPSMHCRESLLPMRAARCLPTLACTHPPTAAAGRGLHVWLGAAARGAARWRHRHLGVCHRGPRGCQRQQRR